MKKKDLDNISEIGRDELIGAKIERLSYLIRDVSSNGFVDRHIFVGLDNGKFFFLSKWCMEVVAGEWCGKYYGTNHRPREFADFSLSESKSDLVRREILGFVESDSLTFDVGLLLAGGIVLTLGVSEAELSYDVCDY